MLSYQHEAVKPSNEISSVSTRKVIVQRHGCGLGLDVSCEEESGSEFLLIEDVGPGPVELWNLSHLGDIMVQAGDRILEVNGVAGDANAMLCAVQASDIVELTVDFSSRSLKADALLRSDFDFGTSSQAPAPQLHDVRAPQPHNGTVMPMIPAPPPQMQVSALQMQVPPELAMSCQVPAPAPEMQMVPAPLMPTQIPTQMQTCPVPPPQRGGRVFIHSGPPKVFVHSAPPQIF